MRRLRSYLLALIETALLEAARRKQQMAQKKTLFISAGHSHSDPGARANGVSEADIVLEFRDLLAAALRERGVRFNKDGTSGQNLPLAQAWPMAAQHDIAIEFHCNAAANPVATGTETLSSVANMELGLLITDVVSRTLGISNRGAKRESSGQHSRLAFVSGGGGIIVELFFLTRPDDLAAYQANKHRLAEALADLLAEETCRED